MTKNNNQSLLISYLIMRRLIGILGISLPVVLIIGLGIKGSENAFQDSISDYYHTPMRDFFVGILCGIGLFLFSYKGYIDKDSRYKYKDNIAGNIACILALLVAFCPTSGTVVGKIHLISAGLFLLTLAFFSLYLFTKGETDTKRKRRRTRIYKWCGSIIIACVVFLILYFIIPDSYLTGLSKCKPILILEIVALWAFGISWITKGKLFWEDI